MQACRKGGGQIRRCRRAAAAPRITTCPPRFLDFATCLQWKCFHTILFSPIAIYIIYGIADYKLRCHWLKYLQKDKIYVVLSCAGRKKNGLELNTCFFVHLHISINEIHNNFGERHQYKYLYATMMYLSMYTGIII